MTTLLITSLLWGFCCAIIGVVYAVVLAGDDTPLNQWFEWLGKWEHKGGWRSWIASPLGGCQNCFSGQLALWTSTAVLPQLFFWEWDMIGSRSFPMLIDVSWLSMFMHFTSAGTAVLCAAFINRAYQWIKNQM